MLNKELCKNCSKILRKPFDQWDERDDDRWNRGLVFCPMRKEEVQEYYWKIIALPPVDCPYRLEQILKEEITENAK